LAPAKVGWKLVIVVKRQAKSTIIASEKAASDTKIRRIAAPNETGEDAFPFAPSVPASERSAPTTSVSATATRQTKPATRKVPLKPRGVSTRKREIRSDTDTNLLG